MLFMGVGSCVMVWCFDDGAPVGGRRVFWRYEWFPDNSGPLRGCSWAFFFVIELSDVLALNGWSLSILSGILPKLCFMDYNLTVCCANVISIGRYITVLQSARIIRMSADFIVIEN